MITLIAVAVAMGGQVPPVPLWPFADSFQRCAELVKADRLVEAIDFCLAARDSASAEADKNEVAAAVATRAKELLATIERRHALPSGLGSPVAPTTPLRAEFVVSRSQISPGDPVCTELRGCSFAVGSTFRQSVFSLPARNAVLTPPGTLQFQIGWRRVGTPPDRFREPNYSLLPIVGVRYGVASWLDFGLVGGASRAGLQGIGAVMDLNVDVGVRLRREGRRSPALVTYAGVSVPTASIESSAGRHNTRVDVVAAKSSIMSSLVTLSAGVVTGASESREAQVVNVSYRQRYEDAIPPLTVNPALTYAVSLEVFRASRLRVVADAFGSATRHQEWQEGGGSVGAVATLGPLGVRATVGRGNRSRPERWFFQVDVSVRAKVDGAGQPR